MSDVRYIATAGMFDGVHRGHHFVLSALVRDANARGLEPLVFTFAQHPMAIVAPHKAPSLLTSPSQREALIASVAGIRRVETIETTAEFLAKDARKFLDDIHERHAVDVFLMGFNNHIGSDRATAAQLADASVEVELLPPLEGDSSVSSSAVRSAIAACDFVHAEALLGHQWLYEGIVVHGRQLGRTIGFPTANIEPAAASLLPKTGDTSKIIMWVVAAVAACIAVIAVLRSKAKKGKKAKSSSSSKTSATAKKPAATTA